MPGVGTVLQQRDEVRAVAIAPLTGDRGLAGAFNSQVLRRALSLLPSVVSQEPVVFANIATRLAEVANGELTQADELSTLE